MRPIPTNSNDSTALLAKTFEALAWEIEDIAVALDKKAVEEEWENQWEKRGKPGFYLR
jgi:hypothetical protein